MQLKSSFLVELRVYFYHPHHHRIVEGWGSRVIIMSREDMLFLGVDRGKGEAGLACSLKKVKLTPEMKVEERGGCMRGRNS